MGWAARANTTVKTPIRPPKTQETQGDKQRADDELLKARARYEMIRARKRKKETA